MLPFGLEITIRAFEELSLFVEEEGATATLLSYKKTVGVFSHIYGKTEANFSGQLNTSAPEDSGASQTS